MKILPEDLDQELEVCEIFRSIAGETSFAGLPAAFIRLSGCNLRCRWCDTPRAWEPGKKMSLARVLELLQKRDPRLIIITGGEPLLQKATITLSRHLISANKWVVLETNGSQDISILPEQLRIILDMKPPSSGEQNQMDFNNLKRLRRRDEVKIVIANRADFEWARELLSKYNLPESINILFSPASNLLEPKQLAQWLLESQIWARLQVQLHKIIWREDQDGCQILDE